MGKWIQTWQRQCWRWTKVRPREAIDSNKSREHVHDMIMEDRRISTNQIAKRLGISQERADHIIRDELGMSKVSARWVSVFWPRNKSTPDAECQEKTWHSLRLTHQFLGTICDYGRDLGSSLSVWDQGAVKTMEASHVTNPKEGQGHTLCWQGHGLCFLGCTGGLPPEGLYCQWTILLWPTEAPKREHQTKEAGNDHKRCVVSPGQCSSVFISGCMATIRDCGFQLVPHPPYLPDLAPWDFHLFLNLKEDLAGQRYTTDKEVIDAVDSYLGDQPRTSTAAASRHSGTAGRRVWTYKGTM